MSGPMAIDKQKEVETGNLFARIEVRPPLMFSCSLERHPEAVPSAEDDQKPNFFYTAILQTLTTHGENILAVVEFSAGEQFKIKDSDTETFKFSAAYLVGAKMTGDLNDAHKKSCIEHLAMGGAWARFKDMFSLIVTQTEEELPALPQSPKIRWKRAPDEKRKAVQEKPEVKETK
jgi:hypothetical protein